MAAPPGPLPDYSKGFESIVNTLEDGVLTILMNRAKERNTFTTGVYLDLMKVFEYADLDDRVRVVILTAEATAPAYCSGADISGGWSSLWSPESEKEGEHAHRDAGGLLSMRIYACRKITIAAVNGHCAGIGMTGLQLPFDIRFCWEGAKLAFPFVRRGITPEATSTWLLPKLLGHSRASSLLLTGSTLPPTHPLLSPLYHTLTPTRAAVYPAALSLARDLAAHTSPLAVAYTKALIQHPGASQEENHVLDSRTLRAMAGAEGDGEEGARAFIERREPRFGGRVGGNLGGFIRG